MCIHDIASGACSHSVPSAAHTRSVASTHHHPVIRSPLLFASQNTTSPRRPVNCICSVYPHQTAGAPTSELLPTTATSKCSQAIKAPALRATLLVLASARQLLLLLLPFLLLVVVAVEVVAAMSHSGRGG